MANMTTTDTMLIVKMNYGTDIRRFTANPASLLNWAAIAKRAVEAFGFADKKYTMSYVDDEGDKITLSSDEELAEAVGLALSTTPAVLRLTLDMAEKPERAGRDLQGLATFVDKIAHQLPEALRSMHSHIELDIPATLAANLRPHAHAVKEGVHEGVTCDKSGVCPIVGNRYHLVGHNYDLCEVEFKKLAGNETSTVLGEALYKKIPPPSDETSKVPVGFHPGVSCDRSGMCPIVGTRYKLRGQNYDLCADEFEKLEEAEKADYVALAPPMINAAAAVANLVHGWAGSNGHGRGGWVRGWGGAYGKGMGGKGMGGKGCGKGEGMGGKGCGKAGGTSGGLAKIAARFISDVTIFDGTQVYPGTQFTKIWKIKNSGEVPWPLGTRVAFVGGDQMATEMSVSIGRETPVMPGEEVAVAVEMTAPADLGRYLGYWRLTGPHCHRKWGQRVWCHVQVVDPSQIDVSQVDVEGAAAEFEKMKSKLPAEEGEEEEEEEPATTVSTSSGTASAFAMVTDRDVPMVDHSLGAAMATEEAKEVVASPPAPLSPIDNESTNAGTSADEDTVIVTDKMVVEALPPTAGAAIPPSATPPPPAPPLTGAALVKESLKAMGFLDETMIEAVLAKHGEDLDACATALAAASEWDSLLDDLNEMGFEDREVNKALMLKNNGNIKRTVKDLIEA